PIPINPLRAAAFGAAVVSILLLLQYAHRRRPFILPWAAGWLLIAPAMLLVARGYAHPAAERAAVGASQLLGICTAMLFLWSADLYRQSSLIRIPLMWLAPVAAWFLLAPLALGTGAVVPAGSL